MQISQKKLTTEGSTNRVSLQKNLLNNKNSSIRSHSIANSKYNSQLHSKSIINSSLAIDPAKIANNLKYTYYVGKGNNQNLIKKILNQRGCWIECNDSTSTFVNFKWQQDQKGYHYNRLVDTGLYKATLNHFQFHSCLCNKQYLFRNLETYCNKNDQDVWDIVPPTFILNVKDQLNMQILKNFIDFYLKYFPKGLRHKNRQYQKIAHDYRKKLKYFFFNSNQKRSLPKLPPMDRAFLNDQIISIQNQEIKMSSQKNISKKQQSSPEKNLLGQSSPLLHKQHSEEGTFGILSLNNNNNFSQSIPLKSSNQDKPFESQNTKILSKIQNSPEKNKKTIQSYSQNTPSSLYLWIVKPTFLNRGRGIQVFSQLSQLYNFINNNVTGYLQKSLKANQEKQEKKIIDYIKRNSQQIKMIGKPEVEQNKLKRQIFISGSGNGNRTESNIEKDPSQAFDGNQYIRIIPKVPSLIKTDCFLIQKYLQKPLLLLNRKFDIRMWVLVTHNLSCYIFKEGYVRLSSYEYSTQATDSSVHLTNNAVQKFNQSYGKLVQGNQMSFKDLRKQMQQKNLNFDSCLSTIHRYAQASLSATYKKLNPLNRRHVFQIFGYDFMIDQYGKPWLIQVNNNPCIQQSSKLVSKLLHRMLDDAFKLTIDVLYPGASSSKKYPVQGYRDNENMWKYLTINKDAK